MPKKRVNLARITQNSVRRATFKKRRDSLLKKVKEISILCGVRACTIVYDPEDENKEPKTWPVASESKEILSSFEIKPMEQSKKMFDQEKYLTQTVMKLEEQKNRVHRNNMEVVESLMRVIEERMRAVKERINFEKNGDSFVESLFNFEKDGDYGMINGSDDNDVVTAVDVADHQDDGFMPDSDLEILFNFDEENYDEGLEELMMKGWKS